MAAKAKAEQDRAKIYKLYKKGIPRSAIAKIVGVEKGTVIGIISRGFMYGDLREYVVSDDEKKLIELYKSGMTYKMMSQELGVTEGTVSGMIHRLRQEGYLGYRK